MTLSPRYFRAALLLDVTLLIWLRPHPTRLLDELRAPRAWVRSVGPDAAAATLTSALIWCAAAWLAVAMTAVALTSLPGATGAAARSLARAIVPRSVYRVLAGATGAAVLLTPLTAGARTPTDPILPPTLPTSAPATAGLPTNLPVATTSDRVVPAPPTGVNSVRVQPGDSLWTISAAQLTPDAPPAEIAKLWPRVYAANRHVIGNDPDLLLPGQPLRLPDLGAEGR